MPRDFKLYLRDIVHAIDRIQTILENLDETAFKGNDVGVDGILFNLMTIGEAVKNIPDEVQNRIPEARWREIARFRDRVVHHYFSLDLNMVWEIVVLHLPVLKTAVEALLQDNEGN
jgi:uncharacterized protein with HEPN domain